MTGTFQVQKIDNHTVCVEMRGPWGLATLTMDAGAWSKALATQRETDGKVK